MTEEPRSRRIALLLCNLGMGGIQRSMLNLATVFWREGLDVDLVVQAARGELAEDLPQGARLVQLAPAAGPPTSLRPLFARSNPARSFIEAMDASVAAETEAGRRELRFLELVPDLVDYLNRERPTALMAAEARFNVMALLAREICDAPMPVIASEHTNLDETRTVFWRDATLAGATADILRHADLVGGVSAGVCAQLTARGLPRDRVRSLASPALLADFERASVSEPPHAWLRSGSPPVVLSVGRIHPLKDLETLVRAHARVAASRPARLLVVGGPDSSQLCNDYFTGLQELARQLGVQREVAFIGVREDPMPYFAHASVFVLSSRYEGLAGTIVQALGCGCPVVSTDCPYGPSELLDDGRFGRLVRVGDVDGMAEAIAATLDHRPERQPLQTRAQTFTAEAAGAVILSAVPALRPAPGATADAERQVTLRPDGASAVNAGKARGARDRAGIHPAALRNWLVERVTRNGGGGPTLSRATADTAAAGPSERGRIGLLFCYLGEGGIERNRLRLAEAFLARGFDVDLLLGSGQRTGDHVIPDGATTTVLERKPMDMALRVLLAGTEPRTAYRLLWPRLKKGRSLRFREKGPLGNGTIVPHLIRYIREQAPLGIIAAEPSFGVPAVWARDMAGRPCRIVISEHNAPLAQEQRFWRDPKFRPVALSAYARADAVVGVSSGIARDLAELGVPGRLLRTIYNPVFSGRLLVQANGRPPHPWLRDSSRPVIVAVGRLRPQKDFATLVRAFALVRRELNGRLIVVGGNQGRPDVEEYYAQLQVLLAELGVGEDVDFVGYQPNPLVFMNHAALFVLSSAHEGLPTVLIEALACGTAVVSTDCPHGPREILEHGRYGSLVPVGDPAAMAAAIRSQLAQPTAPRLLKQRAASFSLDVAAESYLGLLRPRPAAAARSVDPGLNPSTVGRASARVPGS